MDSSIKKSRGICVSISREGVRWWTALDPLMVDQFVTISACDWTALFYLAMTMAVMIISCVYREACEATPCQVSVAAAVCDARAFAPERAGYLKVKKGTQVHRCRMHSA